MTPGQLVFVGLGLYDETDISVKGVKDLESADYVFAEFYTSNLGGFQKKRFEKQIGKPVEVLSREDTEQGDRILQVAKKGIVVFLTCGDPMIATTHVDLRIRAMKQGIPTRIVHSGSIVTAVPGLLGLQNYKFGRTTTLSFPEGEYFPMSPYTVIQENQSLGLHTLVLLDIQADKNRYMTANQGINQLLQMEEQQGEKVISWERLGCVVARAGSMDPMVAADTFRALSRRDFGSPMHTLVIPGRLHFMEVEALQVCAGLPGSLGEKLQKP
jgi:diphthine synthase